MQVDRIADTLTIVAVWEPHGFCHHQLLFSNVQKLSFSPENFFFLFLGVLVGCQWAGDSLGKSPRLALQRRLCNQHRDDVPVLALTHDLRRNDVGGRERCVAVDKVGLGRHAAMGSGRLERRYNLNIQYTPGKSKENLWGHFESYFFHFCQSYTQSTFPSFFPFLVPKFDPLKIALLRIYY